MAQAPLPKVCIIGAGCSGFTTAKRLKDYGIPFDLFKVIVLLRAVDDEGITFARRIPEFIVRRLGYRDVSAQKRNRLPGPDSFSAIAQR